jgi:Domain of unknown function (DUF4189)/NlpC/P60 family
MFSSVKKRLLTISSVTTLMLLYFLASVPAAGAQTHQAVTRQAGSSPSNCGGSACAIAYSQAQRIVFFGNDAKESVNGDGQDDGGVIAEAAALNACYNSGVTDCNVAISVDHGYVSIAIDKSNPEEPWGSGEGSTDSESSKSGSAYWAIQGCESRGGTADACAEGLTTEYSSPSSNASSVGYWGTFTSNRYVEAIATAYSELKTEGSCPGYPSCEEYCLVFMQDVFGWTGGGSWAPPGDADSAWDALNYLKTQHDNEPAGASSDISTAMPTNPPDVGSLVWFGPYPYVKGAPSGHVGIYLGDDQFISATDNGIELYNVSYWSKNIAKYQGFSYAPLKWLEGSGGVG